VILHVGVENHWLSLFRLSHLRHTASLVFLAKLSSIDASLPKPREKWLVCRKSKFLRGGEIIFHELLLKQLSRIGCLI